MKAIAQNRGLTTDGAQLMAAPGVLLLIAGFVLSYPLDWNWGAVADALSPLVGWSGVRLILVALTSIGGAVVLRQSRPVLAQFLAAFGFLATLYPLLAITAGIPVNIGVKGALFSFGLLVLSIAASGYLAARMLPVRALDSSSD